MFGLCKKTYSEEMEESANIMIHNSTKFNMKVDNIFSITGRGTVILGTVSSGEVWVGDTIKFRYQNEEMSAVVNEIEMFMKTVNKVKVGDECGLLLKDEFYKKVEQGTIIYR